MAYTARGEIYTQMRRYDEAIHDFDRAIKLAPNYLHPMYNPYESRAIAKEAKGGAKGAEADRQLYLRLMKNAGKGDASGPKVSGLRAWEPWLTK